MGLFDTLRSGRTKPDREADRRDSASERSYRDSLRDTREANERREAADWDVTRRRAGG